MSSALVALVKLHNLIKVRTSCKKCKKEPYIPRNCARQTERGTLHHRKCYEAIFILAHDNINIKFIMYGISVLTIEINVEINLFTTKL